MPRPRRLPRAIHRTFASVRVRLTLWYLAILAVVLLVFGGAEAASVVRDQQTADRDALMAFAQRLAGSYNPATGTLDLADAWGGLNLHAKTPPTDFGATLLPLKDFVLVLDAHGAVAQALGPLDPSSAALVRARVLGFPNELRRVGGIVEAKLAIRSFGASGGDTASYVLDVTPVGPAARQATLVVGTPSDDGALSLATLVPGLLIAGPLTLVVAALGGYWLASRAMRPVRLITRAADEIGATDLSRRLGLARADELGELAATFDRMLARLEAAFARQRQFTADASHELRTPLSVVAVEAGRALAARRTPEEYERALAVIQAENEHMTRLVGNLLTLARTDAGQAPLALDRVDLGDLALEAVERLAPLARAGGLALVAGPLPETPVLGDRTSLAQLLANLVENAVRYSAGIGMRVVVETGVAAGASGGRQDGRPVAWARVADDGPGIAAEHLPHLFERFYRVDAARARDDSVAPGGSGLGLAIAHWIAEAHGGAIEVRTTPGRGATFELRLPALAG
jgi:signal transduction histidine kinase